MVEQLQYDCLRASQERTAALHARDPRVRRIHQQLAERYEERARALAARGETEVRSEST